GLVSGRDPVGCWERMAKRTVRANRTGSGNWGVQSECWIRLCRAIRSSCGRSAATTRDAPIGALARLSLRAVQRFRHDVESEVRASRGTIRLAQVQWKLGYIVQGAEPIGSQLHPTELVGAGFDPRS